MFFTTYPFIFVLLPIALTGFYLFRRFGPSQGCVYWLIFMSAVFYWSLDHAHLGVLAASIAVNYLLGRYLHSLKIKKSRFARPIFIGSIIFNAAVLIFFKYGHMIFGWKISVPIGLSFFTLLQIGYHIAIFSEKSTPFRASNYALFVGYFPYVVAGPVISKHEYSLDDEVRQVSFDSRLFLSGLALFVFGLCKKLLFADSLVNTVNIGFTANSLGTSLSAADAWVVGTAYVLQLYFDFSAYSDMAAGISAMFGFRLPRNFHSPLKAASIMEYWRRWHITVTRFFTNNLYLLITLKLTRYAKTLKLGPRGHFLITVFTPLMISFTLIGVWHGSGANFILFGFLMATALSVNQAWVRSKRPALFVPLGWALTMLIVMLGMILDKTASYSDAARIFASLVGQGPGVNVMPLDYSVLIKIVVLGLIAVVAPNTSQILSLYLPVLPDALDKEKSIPKLFLWRVGIPGILIISLAMTSALVTIPNAAEFIYYRF